MAVGKRLATSEPLTEHDVAERVDKAVNRALVLLTEIRLIDGNNDMGEPMFDAVRRSRYLTNVGTLLKEELERWGF
jgi:hypothetical protein